MNEVVIKIDVHSRTAEFRRTIHPIHVGDLDEAEKRFEQAVAEVRNWFASEQQREGEIGTVLREATP